MNDPSPDADPPAYEGTPIAPESTELRSMPPPLPPSASEIPAARAAAYDAFSQVMLERLAACDYLGAVIAAESLLEFRPLDPVATDTARLARAELRHLYLDRLGSIDRVPRLAVPLEGLLSHPWVDARAAFLIGRINGIDTIRELVEGAGMQHVTDALRVLSELVLRRAVTLDE
jgi:hypothetical protein